MTSLFYPYVVYKEKKDLDASKLNMDIFFERSTFYAKKRIGELRKWRKEMKIYGNVNSLSDISSKFKTDVVYQAIKSEDYNYWETSLYRYSAIMNELIDWINKQNNGNYSMIANKITLYSVLATDIKEFNTIINESYYSLSEKKYLSFLLDSLFSDLQNKLSIQYPNTSVIDYEVSVPEDGHYSLYVEKKPFTNFDLSKVNIQIDTITAIQDETYQQAGWIKYKNLNLSKHQTSQIKLTTQETVNLNKSSDWININTVKVGTDSASLSIEDKKIGEDNGLVKEISDWTPGSYYLLSFEYNSYNQFFSLDFFESGEKDVSVITSVWSDTLRSTEWKKYQRIISPSNNIHSRFLRISKSMEENAISRELTKTKIDIRQLSFVQIPHPQIVLKKELDIAQVKKQSIPRITFNRINPTKYDIKIENAQDPYLLVFLEGFDNKWKIYLKDNNSKKETFASTVWHYLGKLGYQIARIFTNENNQAQGVVASYDNGNVVERTHRSELINSRVFETWGKKPIADSQHIKVDDYANAWYIQPSDVNNQTEYELVLEMQLQKYFYLFAPLSFGVFVFVLFVIVAKLLKIIK
jgi:hypothetical protein